MRVANSHSIQFFTLDNLVVNPRLARRLPPALAFQYHALPVAKDNDHITVAMADPTDKAAYAAIATGLGAAPYVVQADPVAIDRQLAEIWAQEVQLSSLRLLVYHQDSPIAEKITAYAQYLGQLLHGKLDFFHMPQNGKANLKDLAEKASCNQDLVIFGEPDQSLTQRILSGPAGCRAAEQLPTSVLVARQPRWPLKNILLVTRGYETDNMAVDWLLRLAQPSKAIVTVLALTPETSVMYQQASTYMPHGLADWLATDTPLGRQLRRIAQQLANWEVVGQLRFRQGAPCQQIQREVATGDYDLIVLAADPADWWLRRLLGEVVNPLLGKVERPVLIAKPTTT